MLGGLVVILMAISFIVGLWALGMLIFMWAWNLIMPLLWHGAPHITFIQAIAIGIILGLVKGLFSVTVNKKS